MRGALLSISGVRKKSVQKQNEEERKEKRKIRDKTFRDLGWGSIERVSAGLSLSLSLLLNIFLRFERESGEKKSGGQLHDFSLLFSSKTAPLSLTAFLLLPISLSLSISLTFHPLLFSLPSISSSLITEKCIRDEEEERRTNDAEEAASVQWSCTCLQKLPPLLLSSLSILLLLHPSSLNLPLSVTNDLLRLPA